MLCFAFKVPNPERGKRLAFPAAGKTRTRTQREFWLQFPAQFDRFYSFSLSFFFMSMLPFCLSVSRQKSKLL